MISLQRSPIVKYYMIPGDLLTDILYIFLESEVKYEIKAVNRDENSILLHLPKEGQPINWPMVVENIDHILSEYRQYLNASQLSTSKL